MQAQDYLQFFQDLSFRYWQFTLDNSVYAVCLAISVWLLTAILYSISIGSLKRQIGSYRKAAVEAENALGAAQLQIQQLQEELAVAEQQFEQEAQRTASVQERLNELGSQLSAGIVALAAEPELGQQGLSIREGLEAENLWQRYSAAVKQISETLIEERKTKKELQESYSVQTAKLAEKDLQLQAKQIRFDSQKQQIAKLEETIHEHEGILAQQQESAQQLLAASEEKYLADKARLTQLEQQALEWGQTKQQLEQLQEKLKNQTEQLSKREQFNPVEVQAKQAHTLLAEREPQHVKVELKTSVSQPESQNAVFDTDEAPIRQSTKNAEKSGGIGGKFKSLFGGKQQPEKQEVQSLRQNDEESGTGTSVVREPQVEIPEIPVDRDAATIERLAGSSAQASSDGFGGKFKNMFGLSKEAPAVEQIQAKELNPKPQVEGRDAAIHEREVSIIERSADNAS